MDEPRVLLPDDPAISEVLSLIKSAFAYMDGVIDPPSSMHLLTLDDLCTGRGEVWAVGAPVKACVILTPMPPALYIGKLAVADDMRGQGLARRLIDIADARARLLGLTDLVLQTRVELISNHRAFQALGFTKVAETAHPGYGRPTSFTFSRAL